MSIAVGQLPNRYRYRYLTVIRTRFNVPIYLGAEFEPIGNAVT